VYCAPNKEVVERASFLRYSTIFMHMYLYLSLAVVRCDVDIL